MHFINKKDGSESGSHFLSADLIICNADLPFATQTIMADGSTPTSEETYDWDDRFDYSTGVVAFHWSVTLELHDLLKTHNVFMNAKSKEDAESSWNVLRRDNESRSKAFTAGEPFNFYVHWAGETDPTAAPPGHEAVTVLVPCQGLQRNQDLASLSRDEAIEIYKNQFDEKVVSSIREAVLARLAVLEGLKDLKDYIVDEVIDTPVTYADYYNLAAGVPFGLVREPWFFIPKDFCGFAAIEFTFTFFINNTQSHGLRQLSLTRPGAESSSRDNVLFVGASSRPGNGVPLVLIGAKAVSHRENEFCHHVVSKLRFLLCLSFLHCQTTSGCCEGSAKIKKTSLVKGTSSARRSLKSKTPVVRFLKIKVQERVLLKCVTLIIVVNIWQS